MLAVEARESLNTEDQAERLKALRGDDGHLSTPSESSTPLNPQNYGLMGGTMHEMGGQPDGSQAMFTAVPQADGSQAMITAVAQVLVAKALVRT